jgi:PAP2 superfamily
MRRLPGRIWPSFPSGHTTYGFTSSVLLGILIPERYGEMFARGAEYGTDRIVVGSHYAMDVMGGRTLALYELAHLLANSPGYVDPVNGKSAASKDFRGAVAAARKELQTVLAAACGESVEQCAREDASRFSHTEAVTKMVAATMTYGFPVAWPQTASGTEDVARMAPEAGNLLTAAFPWLSLEQANQILTETEGPGGGFLDTGESDFGVYSRLNLEAAARRVAELAKAQKQ